MIDRHVLAVLGDSWTEGSELPSDTKSQLCYGGQLGRMLNSDTVINYGEPGGSIQHLQLQLSHLINSYLISGSLPVIAVFFITGQNRYMFFDQRNEVVNLTPSGPSVRPAQMARREFLDTVHGFYYQHMQSTTGDNFLLNTNILALQARCRHWEIEDWYISGWQPLDLWPEVDCGRIYGQGQTHCAELLGLTDHTGQLCFDHNPNIVDQGTHPNPQGHAVIAQAVYNMIMTKHLDKDLNSL